MAVSSIAIGMYRKILVNDWRAGNHSWSDWVRVLAHELTHTAERELVGGRITLANQWIREGFADWVGYKVVEAFGGEKFASGREYALKLIANAKAYQTFPSLSQLGRSAEWTTWVRNRGHAATYGQAFIAVDFLIGQKGLPAVTEYFRTSATVNKGELKFAAVFGEPGPCSRGKHTAHRDRNDGSNFRVPVCVLESPCPALRERSSPADASPEHKRRYLRPRSVRGRRRLSMFSGSIVALVTPFRDGKVDWGSLERLVEFHLRGGTNGIVPCGTTGESATLSHDEHDEVIKAVIKAVGKRVPVIAGTGSNSTDEAIRLTREAEKSGADGALMISPYYNRPTQEGIYQHYKKVASEVGIPIVVYNIPARTGSKIEPETLARLAAIKNISGVKEATGSVDQAIDVIRLCGDRLAVYSGEDSLTFSLMALGGKGVISTVANIAPKEMSQLAVACLNEKWQEGRELQFKLMPLIRAVFLETNPIPVKTALSLMGKCTGEVRLPLTQMSEGALGKLKPAMTDFGLL